jgi:hypothetical protein
MKNNTVETYVEYRGFTIYLKNSFVGKRSSKKIWFVKIYNNTKESSVKYSSQHEKYNDAVIESKKHIDTLMESE